MVKNGEGMREFIMWTTSSWHRREGPTRKY